MSARHSCDAGRQHDRFGAGETAFPKGQWLDEEVRGSLRVALSEKELLREAMAGCPPALPPPCRSRLRGGCTARAQPGAWPCTPGGATPFCSGPCSLMVRAAALPAALGGASAPTHRRARRGWLRRRQGPLPAANPRSSFTRLRVRPPRPRAHDGHVLLACGLPSNKRYKVLCHQVSRSVWCGARAWGTEEVGGRTM